MPQLNRTNRELKEQQKQAWERRLQDLENQVASGNLTINVGTKGGSVSGSDISINKIANAQAEIERLQYDLDHGTGEIEDPEMIAMQQMILIMNRRSERTAEMVHKHERELRRQRKTPRMLVSIWSARATWAVIALLIAWPTSQSYVLNNPWQGVGIFALIALLGVLLWWLPQAPNGNGNGKGRRIL